MIRKRKIAPIKDKELVEIYNKINKMLKAEGYKRYELSNYAKPGFESEHNKKYWSETEYIGLGVSAHSYIDGYRYHNTKRLDTYIENMRDGKSVVYMREYISKKERRTERIMLSLRTTQGLDLKRFEKDFKEDLLKTKAYEIKNLQKLNMIEIVDGFMKITNNYFNVSNSIIVELL